MGMVHASHGLPRKRINARAPLLYLARFLLPPGEPPRGHDLMTGNTCSVWMLRMGSGQLVTRLKKPQPRNAGECVQMPAAGQDRSIDKSVACLPKTPAVRGGGCQVSNCSHDAPAAPRGNAWCPPPRQIFDSKILAAILTKVRGDPSKARTAQKGGSRAAAAEEPAGAQEPPPPF